MPPRVRMTFAAFTAALFLIPAVGLYGELSKRTDIWWTPRTMLVPLAESAGRVEVYARGEPLGSLIETGRLRVADQASGTTLAGSDIGFRFNNWDRVRAQRLPLLLWDAAICGALATVFLLLVTNRLAYRGEKEITAV